MGVTLAAGTCTHTCQACLCFLPHTRIAQTHSHTSEGKHQRADISHGWNILALTLARDANSPCVLRGPSRLHTTKLHSQRARRCRSGGHRPAVKNFGSRKRSMRMGVLRDVFLVSLRQSGSLPGILRKVFFFFSVYLPTSLLCELSM